MVKCYKCGKNIGLLSKKYYIYPGENKGAFEITEERVVGDECVHKGKDSKNKEINEK